MNEKAIHYDTLKREVQSEQRLSDVLLTRLKETCLSPTATSGNRVRIVDWAEVPTHAINIRPAKTLSQAGLVGLLLGFGLAFGLGYLDSSLKDPEEAEKYLGFPVIGLISLYLPKRQLLKSSGAQETSLVALDAPRSPAAESYKMLRTNLLFSYTDPPRKVFLITSSHPNEGKTTVASNLAVVMAQMERRVLLVEADLRNPSFWRTFDVDGRPGLSELLLTEKYEETIDPLAESLTIIPAGEKPPNPGELIGSSRMRRFVDFARERFDTVIIDSPPIHAVSDALVLSSLVDGILLVVRSHKTSPDHARRAIAQLLTMNAKLPATQEALMPVLEPAINLGLVMNFLDPREGQQYGGYGYGYYQDYYGDHSKS